MERVVKQWEQAAHGSGRVIIPGGGLKALRQGS